MDIFRIHRKALPLISLVVIAAFLVRPSSAAAASISVPTDFLTLSKGLVGWWTFDGRDMIPNARDRSGNASHGNLAGATTTVAGKLGQALSFNGVNNRVDTGNPSALQIVSQGTLSLWMKSSSSCGYPIAAANFDWDTDTNGYGFVAWTDCASNIGFMIADGSTYNSAVSNGDIFDGKWHLVTGTWNGSTVSIYRDGVFVSSVAQTVTPVTNVNNFVIGGNSAGNYSFGGSLDDVRVYNRALSATEVMQLYNLSSEKQSVTPADPLKRGLMGWWTLDGKDTNWSSATAGTVSDSSGNGLTGTLNNMSRATAPVSGRVGQGLRFDGSDDVISVGTLDIQGALTLCSWARWSATSDSEIITNKDGAGELQYNLEIVVDGTGSAGSISMYWTNGTLVQYVTSVGLITEFNKWYHVCAVRVDQTTVFGYVNGVQYPTTNMFSSAAVPATGGTLSLGGASATSEDFHNGNLDDLRVYNRALSATEILQLYNQGSPRQSVTPADTLKSGLVGWWTFDGPNMISNVKDTSGQGKNGFLVNQAATTTMAGVLGQAISLDGTNDYISVPSTLSSSATYTVSSWLYMDTNQDWTGFAFGFATGNGNVNALMYSNANYPACGGGALNVFGLVTWNCDIRGISSAKQVLTPKKWHHVVMEFHDSDYVSDKMWIDGVSRTMTQQVGTAVNRSLVNSFRIANPQPNALSSDDVWQGGIDDIRVYNRALTNAEVLQLYSMGK